MGSQEKFQREVLKELGAIRLAVENYIALEQQQQRELAEATFQRDQAFLEGVSSRAQELRERVSRRSQTLETSLPELKAPLFGLEETMR